MPIYEYACLECRRRVSVFFRSINQARDADARCPLCGSAQLRRLVSRVTVLKSAESRLDDLADPTLMAGLEGEDPRALGRWMQRMADDTGEPLDGETAEMVARLAAGEDPASIEAGMADQAEEPPSS